VRPTLGFVGLGNIGAPICWHLLDRGYDVHIYDVNPQAIERFCTSRVELATSLPELASSVDVVLLSAQLGHRGAGRSQRGRIGERVLSRQCPDRHIEFEALFDAAHSRVSRGEGGEAARRAGERRGAKGQRGDACGNGRRREEDLLALSGGFAFFWGADLLRRRAQRQTSDQGHKQFALCNHSRQCRRSGPAWGAVWAIPRSAHRGHQCQQRGSNSTEVKFLHYILNRTFDDGFGIA
jgi:NAD binding domain of 6-phosphogluconate dehydrogenase